MGAIGIPIDSLTEVVIGRDQRFARGEAMASLANSNLPGSETVLARVLEDPREKWAYRSAAAIALGRIFSPAAERILVRNLREESGPALLAVLRSLGSIGGPRALAAIDGLKLPSRHPAGRATAFAAALITHRYGLAGHDLRFPKPSELLAAPQRPHLRTIDISVLEKRQTRRVTEALKRYPYGIELSPTVSTRIACAGEVNVVCVNAEFVPGSSLSVLAERKALLAVAALQSPETGDYSVSYLVLTARRRASKTINILVTRCSGNAALAGTGQLADERLEFELHSIRRPGARAIKFRGALSGGVIHADEALSSAAGVSGKTPSRVVVV
jgi:hypothetical protein